MGRDIHIARALWLVPFVVWCTVALAQAVPSITWNSVTPLAVPMNENSAVVHGGYVYVLGGFGQFIRYSTTYFAKIGAGGTLGTWQETTPLPVALADHQAAIDGDHLYVIGGNSNSGQVKTVYSTTFNGDGSLGAWTATTPLPVEAGYGSAITYNGYLLVMIGHSTAVYRAKLNGDGTVGNWTATAPLPTPVRGDHFNCALRVGKYVFATSVPSYVGELSDDAQIVSWTPSTALPDTIELQWANGRTYIDGWIYAIAGGRGLTTQVLAARVSGASLGPWQTTTAIPFSFFGPPAVVEANGLIYAIGDFNQRMAYVGKPSAGQTFAAPILTRPSDGAANQAVATNLTWEAVPTADRYLVQVARDAGFTRTVAMRSVTGATAVPLANLETSTTYYWRVQAIAGVRTSPWSTVWSFTTVAPKPVAGQPDLLVRPYAGGPYFGWCNYSSGQTLTLETRVDVPATFRLAVRNTARKTDDFIIAGPASDGDWQVQYRDAAGTDITSQVTGPGWRVPCTVGEIKEFTAIVSPGPNAASYTRHTITVLAVSGTNELLRDAVSLTSVCTPR